MTQGTRLSPEQLEDLARLFVEFGGNASAVAREMSVSVSTVTRNLARLGKQSRANLQKQWLRAGLFTGQAYLEAAIEEVGEVFTREKLDGAAVDADATAKLLNALSKANGTLMAMQRREEQRRQAKLTRAKTRAETDAIEARTSELPPMEVLKAKLSPAQVLELMRGLSNEQLDALRALTRPKEAPAQEG